MNSPCTINAISAAYFDKLAAGSIFILIWYIRLAHALYRLRLFVGSLLRMYLLRSVRSYRFTKVRKKLRLYFAF